MCFKTKGSKIRKADADIICYKDMYRKIQRASGTIYYKSLFQLFYYDLNVVYGGKSKLRIFLCWLFNIKIGSAGYHSYIEPYDIHVYPYVKCIIPKGSLYLMNDTEYCSTAIKVIGDI